MAGLWKVYRRPRPSMRNTWLRWFCLSLCYLAFAGSLSRAEGVAALLAGAFAALISVGIRSMGEPRLVLRGDWTRVLARIIPQLTRDMARVGFVLARALASGHGHRGRIVHESGPAGGPVGDGAGRRAAAALLVSVTPDSVAMETGEDTFPVHRLCRSAGPARRGSGVP